MPTREQLLDPDYIPIIGELRFLKQIDDEDAGKQPTLQQYMPKIGRQDQGWHDVPTINEEEERKVRDSR